ncbi:MAG: hypothetical protein JXB48_00635 [Candidatus Latescibacteria bacterium]|nr:hypothetical protein [Candidatus Latescibacterota bacterium]
MKIQGLPLNDGGLQRVENKKAEKITAGNTQKGDVVELSRSVRGGDHEISSHYAIPIEFLERTELVNAITKNIADKSYNQPDVQVTIAEKILESAVLNDTISSITVEKNGTPEIRDDIINRITDKVSQKYYDQPEVMEQIAGRIIDALGVSGVL